MFVAHVEGPLNEEGNPKSEMIFDLKSNSMQDATNELFSYFGLIPGQEGYYPSQELGKAKIYEVVSVNNVDIEAQREEKAKVEAEIFAEQESRREMAQFEKQRQKHKVRR